MQNRAQLMATYGSQKATDVFDNVGAELVLGTGDQVLAKQIEERLGDATINVITRTRPRFLPFFNVARQTDAEHPRRRPAILAAEIMRMPPHQMLVLRAGMRAATEGPVVPGSGVQGQTNITPGDPAATYRGADG